MSAGGLDQPARPRARSSNARAALAEVAAHEDGVAKNSTVDRALRVLEAFLVDQPDLSLADLSKLLGLDKSVIHRILGTFVRRGFLQQDPLTKRYRVGVRTWEIGQRYVASSPLAELAADVLAGTLQQRPYTTGYFATLDGDNVVILTTVRGPGPVNIYIDPGTRMPAARTATGRAMLAHLPEAQLRRLLPRLQAQLQGNGKPGSAQELLDELDTTRGRGHAENRGQYFPGIGTVACCIRDASGAPVAALSVDFPLAPESGPLFDELPRVLQDAVGGLERSIGAAQGALGGR